MRILLLFLLFQLPVPQAPIKPPEGVGGGTQAGGRGEEYTFRISEKCFFYKGYTNMPKHPAPGNCRKLIVFNHVYHSPIYYVWDLTAPELWRVYGPPLPNQIIPEKVMLFDKTYAFAGDIVVEAPKGHVIKLQVSGR